MDVEVYTWDGHAINDVTNYVSWFSNQSFYKQGSANVLEAKRTDRPPVMLGKEPLSKKFFLRIEPKGTLETQWDQLKLWFDTYDKTPRQLIIKDAADSDRQWYVYATLEEDVQFDQRGIIYRLYCADPVWRTVTEDSDVWNLTASGQTNDIVVLGNRYSRPIFDIMPTALKTGGLGYRQYRVWYNPNLDAGQAKRLQDLTNDAWNTSALISDNSNKCQINDGAGITAVATTIPYDTVTGTLPSQGMGYCGTEQISWTGKTGTTSGNLTGVTRGIGGTTAAIHADNDVIYVSHLQADGRDVRAYVNGVSVPRWLRGVNTTTTQVFALLDWEPGLSLELRTDIASSGALTTLEFATSAAQSLLKLQEKNHKALVIGSEVFTFTSVNMTTLTVGGTITRAAYGSSMAAHAIGDMAWWVQHSIEVAYGNASLSAPSQDESSAPLMDLDNTTNTSHKFLLFRDSTGLRAGQWGTGVTMGQNAKIFFGPHQTDADPATELGMYDAPYNSGYLRPDTYKIEAQYYDMAGITTVTMSGDKRRESTDWSTFSGLRKSLNGVVFVDVFNEATPGSAASWTAWTQSAVSLSGTYRYLKLAHEGITKAVSGNAHTFELQTATLTLASGTVPQLAFSSAEIADSYELNLTITNEDTDLYLQVQGLIDKDATLRVDTDKKTVSYIANNVNKFAYLKVGVRGEWLPLSVKDAHLSGSDLVNTLTVTDPGLTGLRVTTKVRHRWA